MYWYLNCLPLVIDCVIEIYSIFQKFCGFRYEYNHISTIVMFLWLLILSPIYLLCINFNYINKKSITYALSVISMVSVIVARVVITIIFHKIKWGTFIGDVPEGIYYLLIFVPLIIVLIGISIFYFVKGRC